MPDITKCPCAPIDRHLAMDVAFCSPCGPTCGRDDHFFLAEASGPWAVSPDHRTGRHCSNGNKIAISNSRSKRRMTRAVSSRFTVRQRVISRCTVSKFHVRPTVSHRLCFRLSCLRRAYEPDPDCRYSRYRRLSGIGFLILNSNLVLTPSIHLQVIRPTLFAPQADEVPTRRDDLGQCAGKPCASCSQSCDAQNTRPQTAVSKVAIVSIAQNSQRRPRLSIIACGKGAATRERRVVVCRSVNPLYRLSVVAIQTVICS